ncbi:MAG: LapA family protein [Pseudomonadota bacterium]
MRMLKLLALSLFGLGLVVVGVANIAPVDLHLLPPELGLEATRLTAVPLSAVILVSVLVGVVIGHLMEWVREAKHRRMVEERNREVGRLRREIRRLSDRIGDGEEGLPQLPARR